MVGTVVHAQRRTSGKAKGAVAASERRIGLDAWGACPEGLWGFYGRYGKRALDLLVVVAMLAALGPLMLGLAGLVALQGGRPFFAHRRIGQGGRPFDCYKIRSMVPDAEARLAAILATDAAAAAEWERGRKLRHDPRVTRFGQFLRATSLDELPQLWNVLRGEMSLVGPRPITAGELSCYGADGAAYLALRPGLTGPWQVEGRNDVTYAERVALDADYAASVCLLGDLRILLMTAWAVIRATGR